jgi:hypothetical protein
MGLKSVFHEKRLSEIRRIRVENRETEECHAVSVEIKCGFHPKPNTRNNQCSQFDPPTKAGF